MLIDWLIYGLITWGVAALLNAIAFKEKPASTPVAWALTIIIFFVNLVALTFLKFVRYQMLSDGLGVSVGPGNPLDAAGAFVFSWLFFSLLHRAKSTSPIASAIASQLKVSSSPARAAPALRSTATPTLEPLPSRTAYEASDSVSVGESRRGVASIDKPPPIATLGPLVANPESACERTREKIATGSTQANEEASVSAGHLSEEMFWEKAFAELGGSGRRHGLWAKAYAEAQGSDSLARAHYLKWRAQQLAEEHRQALLKEARLREDQVRRAEAARMPEHPEQTEQERVSRPIRVDEPPSSDEESLANNPTVMWIGAVVVLVFLLIAVSAA